MRPGRLLLLALTALLLPGDPAPAQEAAQASALRTFLDCQNVGCDFDYFRREITWVDWMRDRQLAEVHLLVTGQTTGGGGREYTLRFIGLGRFEGRDHELRTVTEQSATADEIRRTLSQVMQLGLTGYAAAAGLGSRLSVQYQAPAGGTRAVQQVDDPWNYWLFRIAANGFLQGQSLTSFGNLNGSVRATRTTDRFKLRFQARGSINTSEFTLSDNSTISTNTKSYGADALAVWSLGDHWSAGLQAELEHSDTRNLSRSLQWAPGIEYNIFPYAQSTRRQLTLLYEIGLTAFRYQDTTIYNRTAETLPYQRLVVSLVSREPWGSANVSLSGSHYFRDLGQNSLNLSGGLSFRIVKGLQVNVSGNYARIRDQLFLPKAGATDEEILLQLRQLQTSYRYFVSLGLSYTFGTAFNNVVNPRFGNTGGEFFFF